MRGISGGGGEHRCECGCFVDAGPAACVGETGFALMGALPCVMHVHRCRREGLHADGLEALGWPTLARGAFGEPPTPACVSR